MGSIFYVSPYIYIYIYEGHWISIFGEKSNNFFFFQNLFSKMKILHGLELIHCKIVILVMFFLIPQKYFLTLIKIAAYQPDL